MDGFCGQGAIRPPYFSADLSLRASLISDLLIEERETPMRPTKAPSCLVLAAFVLATHIVLSDAQCAYEAMSAGVEGFVPKNLAGVQGCTRQLLSQGLPLGESCYVQCSMPQQQAPCPPFTDSQFMFVQSPGTSHRILLEHHSDTSARQPA